MRFPFTRSHRFALVLLAAVLVLLTVPDVGLLGACRAQGADLSSEDADGIPYDRLVDKLSTQTRAKAPQVPTTDYLDQAKVHASVAYANSMYTLQTAKGSSIGMSQSGFEVALGLDLLSENFAGEVSFLNLGQTSVQNVQVSASEFDLRFFYHTHVGSSWGYRAGAGIGSRDFRLAYQDSTPGGDFVIPTAVLFGGAETYLTDQFSLGAEAALRNALTAQDAPERTSLDLLVRISGKF